MGKLKPHKKFIEEVKRKCKNYKVLEEYSGALKPILTRHLECGFEWKIAPHDLLRGHGCPRCGNKKEIKTHRQFLKDLRKIHKNRYKILGIYSGCMKSILVEHTRCKYKWEITPTNLLMRRRYGCPTCDRKHSKLSIDWLNKISRKEKKKIQHAENGGEYTIPRTRLKVDGFHKKSNTVYEFYGDKFHGNLEIFSPKDRCHPYSNKIAKELYDETMRREKQLQKRGFKIRTIWEFDYNLGQY